MGRLLMGALLVAAVAGLAWLWRGARREAISNAPTPAQAALASASAPAESLAPVLVERTAASAESTRHELERELSGREVAEREPGAPEAGEGRDDVRIVVVDRSGNPLAGIRLRLERAASDPDRSSIPGARVTDAAGRACFAGIRRALESASVPWALLHELPCAEPPRLALDRATLAGPEVVSVLPSGGALEVVVRDVDGSAAPERSTVKLKLVRDEDRLNPALSGPHWEAEPRSGTVRFPWVELGRSWEVSAWRPDGTVPSRTRTRGPSAADESVTVAIVLGADHPIVSFRAVDAGGKPLASVELRLGRAEMFGFTESTLETDAAGRFTVDGVAPHLGGWSFLVTHRPAAGPQLQGRASLPGSAEVGWNDGGDVVLTSEPLLCAGRVTDVSGAPVPAADVVAGPDERHGWFNRSQTIRGATDEQGCFELRGLWHGDEFELRAEQHWPRSEPFHSRFHGFRVHIDGRILGGEEDEPESHAGERPLRSDMLRVRQGQRDVELVLSPRYSLSGRLLVDRGVDPRAIQFELRISGAQVPADRRRDLDRDDGAVFTLLPVAAGEYELRCILDGMELTRIERLALRDDVDLGDIDLRDRLQLCEIVLLGAEEPAKVEGEVVWRPHGTDERHTVRIEGARARILAPSLPIDVAVRPKRYRHVLLEKVSARRELVLEPPLRVRLVLHTDGEFPEPPHFLQCHLRQGDDVVSEPVGMHYFTPESREVELLVSAPGPLRVFWGIEQRFEGAHSGGARGTGVLGGHEAAIEVLDVPGEQVFPIELDAAALTALARDPPF